MNFAQYNQKNPVYYTYLLHCADDTFYCGWTVDLMRRLAIHNRGKGARYTRVRLPVEIVYFEVFPTRADAMKRERQIKAMNRVRKLSLIGGKNGIEF